MTSQGYEFKEPNHYCCDLYVRNRGPISRFIAWATRARREERTLATHQAKLIWGTAAWTIVVHAVQGRGVVFDRWDEYHARLVKDKAEWAIVAPKKAVLLDGFFLMNEAFKMSGWRYSNLELPLQLIDGILSKFFSKDKMGLDVIVFRKMGNLWKKGVICSKTGNRLDIKLGFKPKMLEYGAPDDGWDYVSQSADWEILFESKRWRKP